jgi:Protein of unknown function (DUF664)
MAKYEPKTNLREYIQGGRDTRLRELSGLSDYDARRPLVPAGTALLGLVEHKSRLVLAYYREAPERPSGEMSGGFRGTLEPNANMWANADGSR